MKKNIKLNFNYIMFLHYSNHCESVTKKKSFITLTPDRLKDLA
jgi:hypothetical protein